MSKQWVLTASMCADMCTEGNYIKREVEKAFAPRKTDGVVKGGTVTAVIVESEPITLEQFKAFMEEDNA